MSRAFARAPSSVSGDPESEARFRELSEAYAVLSRPEARRLYDGLGWRRRPGLRARPARAYHSNKRRLLQDLEGLIVSAQGGRPEREPTRVVRQAGLDADALAARREERGRLEVRSDLATPARARGDEGQSRTMSQDGFSPSTHANPAAALGGEDRRPVDVSVPPGARDSDVVAVGAEEVAIVRIVPPRKRAVVRTAALAGLVVALGFLLFLLAF